MNLISRLSEIVARLKSPGPRGLWFNRLTALVLSVWVTHGILRAVFLLRKDAFGFPIVGKTDWYIFHALFLDLHWIALWSSPFLVAMLILGTRPGFGAWIFTLLAFLHSLILLGTVIDHETLRFMGMHFDPGFAATYANGAAVSEIFRFLASDASLPGLPYFLFFGSPVFAALAYWLISRSKWVRSPAWKPKPALWILAGCLVGYAFLYHVWTGGHRMAKLRPLVTSIQMSVERRPHLPLTGDSLSILADAYGRHWKSTGGDTAWTFPNPEYPYYREPTTPAPQRADTGAWNFILFLLESHRALNVGHLMPFGAVDSATPFLDSLARAGHYWTRMITSGLPTIQALMSTHLSALQHPTRYISSEFTGLRHEAFTSVLARHGYRTHFFSAADPAWDNQTPWLRKWYQDITYDRSREEDATMFAHMSRWMRDSLSGPFFVTAITKTNHYPFNPVPGVRPLPPTATLSERMSATMAYTDSSLRAFVESIRGEPWFSRTILIAMADHGFPLSEHGSSTIGHGLYTENVWLPFVIAGSHPALGPPRTHSDLAAQMDLGPTILDLAGFREPNSYMGHSLLSPASPENQFSLCLHGNQALAEKGDYRWHGAWGDVPRELGEEMFDVTTDRLERQDILPERSTSADSLKARVRALARLHLHVVEQDRLWPGTFPR